MGVYWRNGKAYGRKRIKGEEYRHPLGATSKRAADTAFETWVANLRASLKAPATAEATPYEDAVRNFTENHFPTLKESSRKRYVQSLLVMNPHFAGKTLQAIGKGDISKFVAARRNAGKASPRRRGPAPRGSRSEERHIAISDAAIIRDLQCLSSVFTVAADFELCDVNPAAAFIKAHGRRGTLVNSPPRTRYLSHDEETRILHYAIARAADPEAIRRKEKAMIAAAIALYIDLGFRAQELLNARRSWVDLARNEITVPREFSKSGEPRTIPLFARARRIIEMLPENKHTDLLLWRCETGRKFRDLNKTVQAIGAGAGVFGFDVHDLRRTCGCRLLQDHRMTMAEVSRWLGHASTEQTESTYAFLKTENLHDAVGGRVLDKAARERLASLFDATFARLVGGPPPASEFEALPAPSDGQGTAA